MNKKNKINLKIVPWMSTIYILFSVVLVPWTIYLSISLPSRHAFRHWDVSWVGLDIGILISLLLTGIFAWVKSRWVVISATVASTLLVADAWFDIISERPGRQLNEAIILAIVFEIPLAIVSLRVAIRTLIHNID